MDQQQLSDPDNDEHSMAHIHLADFSHCTPISLPSKTDHLHPTCLCRGVSGPNLCTGTDRKSTYLELQIPSCTMWVIQQWRRSSFCAQAKNVSMCSSLIRTSCFQSMVQMCDCWIFLVWTISRGRPVDEYISLKISFHKTKQFYRYIYFFFLRRSFLYSFLTWDILTFSENGEITPKSPISLFNMVSSLCRGQVVYISEDNPNKIPLRHLP